MGCGSEGALMYLGNKDQLYFEPAIAPYGVKSSIGAGDALLSAFTCLYNKGYPLEECFKKAVLFAGIKVSSSGGSNGFISLKQLNELFNNL